MQRKLPKAKKVELRDEEIRPTVACRIRTCSAPRVRVPWSFRALIRDVRADTGKGKFQRIAPWKPALAGVCGGMLRRVITDQAGSHRGPRSCGAPQRVYRCRNVPKNVPKLRAPSAPFAAPHGAVPRLPAPWAVGRVPPSRESIPTFPPFPPFLRFSPICFEFCVFKGKNSYGGQINHPQGNPQGGAKIRPPRMAIWRGARDASSGPNGRFTQLARRLIGVKTLKTTAAKSCLGGCGLKYRHVMKGPKRFVDSSGRRHTSRSPKFPTF